ncbi:hypothetical protein [Paeniglutamicibacter cryotolerans]|uniref:Uncharacterized protein n=1 Tax=Paeniglutamicibacter cryotolerans TaxID=670079 RepID=A0A839QER5_9MICC|nr:hypothetical protein [Paeniglutamicibacter cryotolerans]MBB2994103.1 hypothetical protein [Paeniglutamicibacter cryotolerans]
MKKFLGLTLATMVLAGGVFFGSAANQAPGSNTTVTPGGGISQLSGNNNWPL